MSKQWYRFAQRIRLFVERRKRQFNCCQVWKHGIDVSCHLFCHRVVMTRTKQHWWSKQEQFITRVRNLTLFVNIYCFQHALLLRDATTLSNRSFCKLGYWVHVACGLYKDIHNPVILCCELCTCYWYYLVAPTLDHTQSAWITPTFCSNVQRYDFYYHGLQYTITTGLHDMQLGFNWMQLGCRCNTVHVYWAIFNFLKTCFFTPCTTII